MKKLRGLIRLTRRAFPGFAEENVALRDTARILAPLRDAAAALESFDKLVEHVKLGEQQAFRAHLVAARDAAQSDSEAPGRMDEARLRLQALQTRLPDWELTEDGWQAIAPGLTATYARARAARKASTGEELHDWRKRAKYHWYHARLLRPIWPAMMAPHVAAADDLGELLGDRHDLDVLLPQIAEAGLSDAATAQLTTALRDHATRLEHAAHAMGQRLLADKPKALARRWGKWWRLAQEG